MIRKSNLAMLLTIAVLMFVVMCTTLSMHGCTNDSSKSIDDIEVPVQDSIDSMKTVIYQDLQAEIRDYFFKNCPRVKQRNIHQVIPHLIDKAIDNDIDLCFIIAQMQIETAFGTTGIGKSRKSMFGIYKTYHTYEEGIDDYIRNLKRHYLSDNRTIHHLMKKYTTKSGYRYAGDPIYESRLSAQYKKILKNTEIDALEKALKELMMPPGQS